MWAEVVQVSAQSAQSLETQANQTEDPRQKMTMLYQAAEKYLASDPKRASETAHRSYLLAEQLGDKTMMSRTIFINGEGRIKQNDLGGAKVRFATAKDLATEIHDNDFTIKALNKLVDICKRQGSTAEANRYATQVADLKKAKTPTSSGGAVAVTPSQAGKQPTPTNPAEMERLRQQFQQERNQLLAERQRLAGEVVVLQRERDQINATLNKTQLQTQRLSVETQQAKNAANVQAQQAQQLATERDEVSRKLSLKQLLLEGLQNEAILDSITNAQVLQEREYRLTKERNTRNVLILALGFFIVLGALIYKRFLDNKKQQKILEEKNKIIQEEREKSDELLLNILPLPIAQELKINGKAKAQRYEKASVLFTDFRNFTKISEQLTPEQLVNELDTYFKAFDFIIKQYNIEKIKTIGDAYMCAIGLADGQELPLALIKAAVEMQEYIADVKIEKVQNNEPFFELKVGIHTGPVVAGVVGVNKFAYDIWGDTVNIAARLQDNCEPGKVNISEAVYLAIKYKYNCIPRGKIQAKNKGAIDMYYVGEEIKS